MKPKEIIKKLVNFYNILTTSFGLGTPYPPFKNEARKAIIRRIQQIDNESTTRQLQIHIQYMGKQPELTCKDKIKLGMLTGALGFFIEEHYPAIYYLFQFPIELIGGLSSALLLIGSCFCIRIDFTNDLAMIRAKDFVSKGDYLNASKLHLREEKKHMDIALNYMDQLSRTIISFFAWPIATLPYKLPIQLLSDWVTNNSHKKGFSKYLKKIRETHSKESVSSALKIMPMATVSKDFYDNLLTKYDGHGSPVTINDLELPNDAFNIIKLFFASEETLKLAQKIHKEFGKRYKIYNSCLHTFFCQDCLNKEEATKHETKNREEEEIIIDEKHPLLQQDDSINYTK